MGRSQRRFYADLEQALRRGECPAVDGNISYIFVFVYKLLGTVRTQGFRALHDYLIHLAEGYAEEEKVVFYCRHWAYDCLLGLREYEAYLEKTEPPTPLGTSTHPSNLRLNIQRYCGLTANPLDIVRMFGSRNSRFIREHLGLYRDHLKGAFDAAAERDGPWFSRMTRGLSEPEHRYPHQLFQGAMVEWDLASLEFGLLCFYTDGALESQVKELGREAESAARKAVGVPAVGEGWVSETALFRALQEHFTRTVVIQHGQPEWLGRQHFDVWFPDWKLAVEYHGEQHFQAVDFFGGAEAFEKNVERDERKATLARTHGVKLLVVTQADNTADLIMQIEALQAARGPVLPPDP